ncbi:MAG: hypothetical protein ACLRM9_05340 [Collinsella aerofaciens]
MLGIPLSAAWRYANAGDINENLILRDVRVFLSTYGGGNIRISEMKGLESI